VFGPFWNLLDVARDFNPSIVSSTPGLQYQFWRHLTSAKIAHTPIKASKPPAVRSFPGYTMESYLKLEDSESLKAKIDKRAPDLFKARKGKPQLEVKGYTEKRIEEGKDFVFIEDHRDVENMFDLKALRHVRELALSIS
jgi:hypothetical protein